MKELINILTTVFNRLRNGEELPPDWKTAIIYWIYKEMGKSVEPQLALLTHYLVLLRKSIFFIVVNENGFVAVILAWISLDVFTWFFETYPY
jgi:hypothetical protein